MSHKRVFASLVAGVAAAGLCAAPAPSAKNDGGSWVATDPALCERLQHTFLDTAAASDRHARYRYSDTDLGRYLTRDGEFHFVYRVVYDNLGGEVARAALVVGTSGTFGTVTRREVRAGTTTYAFGGSGGCLRLVDEQGLWNLALGRLLIGKAACDDGGWRSAKAIETSSLRGTSQTPPDAVEFANHGDCVSASRHGLLVIKPTEGAG